MKQLGELFQLTKKGPAFSSKLRQFLELQDHETKNQQSVEPEVC